MNKVVGSLSQDDIKLINKDFQKHINDGKCKKHFGVIVVLDVLGWKNNATPEFMERYFSLINSLRSQINDTRLRCTSQPELSNISVNVLSDTIVICIDGSYPYCELNIFSAINYFIANSLKNGIIYRGSISYGEYYINQPGNAFIGKPIYEALKLAEQTDWSGVIITDSLANALLKNNSIDSLIALNIFPYPIPFKQGYGTKDQLVLYPSLKILKLRAQISNVAELKTLYKGIILIDQNDDNVLKYNNTCMFLDYLESIGWFRLN